MGGVYALRNLYELMCRQRRLGKLGQQWATVFTSRSSPTLVYGFEPCIAHHCKELVTSIYLAPEQARPDEPSHRRVGMVVPAAAARLATVAFGRRRPSAAHRCRRSSHHHECHRDTHRTMAVSRSLLSKHGLNRARHPLPPGCHQRQSTSGIPTAAWQLLRPLHRR